MSNPRPIAKRGFLAIVGILTWLFLVAQPTVWAQADQGGGGFGGGGFGGAGQGGGQGNGQGNFAGGIIINASGVISAPQAKAINLKLEQKRLKELAGQQLDGRMNRPSELRKVSLVQLDKQLAERIANHETIEPELNYLAGLTRIDYVFVDEDHQDLILAGPAEAFAPMQDNRVVGVETGRPVLVLEDLLSTFRLRPDLALGCSFDPDPQRLSQANQFNSASSQAMTAAMAQQKFVRMADILGYWDVSVFGLPNQSHSALTAVEADFRLKRLALGIDRPGIRGFRSYMEMIRPGDNMMKRWWFAPRYDLIERSPDENAFHLSGPRLQLLSQEELVDLQGNRSDAAFKNVSAERYTRQFNEHLEELCQRVPSFAGIQNLFDLAVVSALIKQYQLDQKISWKPQVLLSEDRLPLPQYQVPTRVASQVNTRMSSNRMLIGLIGGGVTIVPSRIVSRVNEWQQDEVPDYRPKTDGQWWWD